MNDQTTRPAVDHAATLRDLFAMSALSGLIASERSRLGGDSEAHLAQRAYVIADAMIWVRAR
jgi:hypothetical protein